MEKTKRDQLKNIIKNTKIKGVLMIVFIETITLQLNNEVQTFL